MTKVLEIKSFEEVRRIRDSAWEENSSNWSKSRNLPSRLKDNLYRYVKQNLDLLDGLLVDLGCGNAWLFDFLNKEKEIKVQYLGVDINNIFINRNNEKFKEESSVNFIKVDLELENGLNVNFLKKSKLFIGCLSFIEIVDLERAFFNVSKNMSVKDLLMIIVLDPSFEIFRMSEDINALESNTLNFFNYEKSYYKKEIIIDNKINFKSEYVGILHKMEDYILSATQSGLTLSSIESINCYNVKEKKGTIYRVLKFQKNAR